MPGARKRIRAIVIRGRIDVPPEISQPVHPHPLEVILDSVLEDELCFFWRVLESRVQSKFMENITFKSHVTLKNHLGSAGAFEDRWRYKSRHEFSLAFKPCISRSPSVFIGLDRDCRVQ